MRILVITFAMLALAAVPCAWDSAPGESPPIAALFSLLSPADAGSMERAQTAEGTFVATPSDNVLAHYVRY
ncbi:hypothetical protein [Rhizobium mesoamericanum]|uniref:hypothetical protein n=1 Tax=Rhizobium mesoamericanum TaxID=1079800 RepID=UPI000410D82A|nr:hypothetical protein [Rhizobium mesoamericanum]